MINRNLHLFMALCLLVCGCAETARVGRTAGRRTDDVYDAATSVYFNKSVDIKIVFPKEKWFIYSRLDRAPKQVFPDGRQMEKEFGFEFALLGHDVSKTLFVALMIEHNISGMSPLEYAKVWKDISKEALYEVNPVDEYMREREIGEQDGAEWGFQGDFGGMTLTDRRFIFLRNNYACCLRFWFPTVLFESRKAEMENIINSITFP